MDDSSSNADDDMIIRKPKEFALNNAEDFEFNQSSTTWSMQRQRRQNRAFGSRKGSRLQRSSSLRQEFEQRSSDFLPETLDRTSFEHRRSSSFSNSEEEAFRHIPPPPRPPRTSLRMTRSATLPTNMPGVQAGGSMPRRRLSSQQRSNSLALGSASNLGRMQHTRSSSSLPLDLFGMVENQPQNFSAEEESFDRDRKKPRARRASAMGSIPSLRSPSFQEKMASLVGGASPFSGGFVAESPLPEISADLFNSPGSKSSNRKRPVCGSPSSGDDGSTIMTMSSNTSSRRTRRLSPSKLPPNIENPLYSDPSHSFHEVRDMNQDSDDDDSDCNVDASFHQDTSFTSHTGDIFVHGAEEKKDDDEQEGTEGNEILSTMSSLDDLKFLISALNQEKTKSSSGLNRLWMVIPKKSWRVARRAAFVKWLTERLQFDCHFLGSGIFVLKITPSAGEELLGRLKASLQEYQVEPSTEVPPSQVLIAASIDTATKDRPPRSKKPHPPSLECSLGFDLTLNMEKLTVHDKPDLRPKQLLLGSARSSFGSSRPSLDASVCDPGGLYLPGHETPMPRSVPMCLSSADHTLASRSRNSSISVPMSVAPMQNLEFVETPQIKQDVGWGSRPVVGRDWGTSKIVDKNITDAADEVMREVESALATRNSNVSDDCLPCMPMNDDVDCLKRRTSHLSIDEVVEEQDSLMEDEDDEKALRRRRASLAKRNRVSLYAAASVNSSRVLFPRKSVFPTVAESVSLDEQPLLSTETHVFPEVRPSDQDQFTVTSVVRDDIILGKIFSFLSEKDLMRSSSPVCTEWYEASATAYARLMMASVGYVEDDGDEDDIEDDSSFGEEIKGNGGQISLTARDWEYLTMRFPWGTFLSEGGFKRVYKVFNTAVNAEEAISVMDVDAITDKKTIAAELVVSVLLSSISRRGICPNFVITRGVFTLPYEPPHTHWGSDKNKVPKGSKYIPAKIGRKPREPKNPEPGRFQFIRMELCNRGDAECFIAKQPGKQLDRHIARCALFQIAFALHVGAERFSLKHYDIKLLNVFVQAVESSHDFVLRYGLGSHTFALVMPGDTAFIAKLADYGTANIRSESNGLPVSVAQFTTLENTPPEFMIMGDRATQGHGHDNWGLGLCMLHLFTGHAPYEEIMEDVRCPPILKKKLKQIWENKKVKDFSVIRSVIRADVYEDGNGNIIEGEPDESLYDTLYRYLVLFGLPEKQLEGKATSPVWKAIAASLQAKEGPCGRRRVQGTDTLRYENDCRIYSIHYGSNELISNARACLQAMGGGLDLLLRLCTYDPSDRVTSLQVINSPFMEYLREPPGATYDVDATVQTYVA